MIRIGMIVLVSVAVMLPSAPACGATLEWINKDFKNTTGETRNDLHWAIAGHVKDAIVGTYDPPELPDAEINETGPAPVTWVEWSGGDVADGTTVHCGVLVDWDEIPGQRFRHGAYWTQDGKLMERVAGCASANVEFGEVIDVDVANIEDIDAPALEVFEFSYAIVDEPFELAELTWFNPDVPWVPVSWAGVIPPAGSLHMGALPGAEPGRFFVLQFAVNFAGDPPENAGHIIVQRQVTAPAAVPATALWSLIGLAVLIVTCAYVVFARRRETPQPA